MTRERLAMCLAAVVLLAAYAFMGARYLSAQREQVALAEQVAAAREVVELIPAPAADLAGRLAAAKTELDMAQNGFPWDVDTTEVIDIILGLADASDVKALPLTTEAWSVTQLAGYEYRSLLLDVTVEGEWADVVAFISRLESGQVPTLVLHDVVMSSRHEESGSGGPASETVRVKAVLHLAVYAGVGTTG